VAVASAGLDASLHLIPRKKERRKNAKIRELLGLEPVNPGDCER